MHSHPFLFTLVTQTSPFKQDMVHAQQPPVYTKETRLTLKDKQHIFGGFSFQSGSFKVTVLHVFHLILDEFTRIYLKNLKRRSWMLQKLQPSPVGAGEETT